MDANPRISGSSPTATADVAAGQDLSITTASGSIPPFPPPNRDPISIELAVMESALRGMRDIWLAGDKTDRTSLLREMKSTMRSLRGAGFTDPGWQNAALRFIQGMESLDAVMKQLRTLVKAAQNTAKSE